MTQPILKFAFVVLTALIAIPSYAPAAESSDNSPRLLVHLLSYIANDYPGAVASGGKVISESEFHEQVEFSKSAEDTSKQIKQLGDHPDITRGVTELKNLIGRKGEPVDVDQLARSLQAKVIDATQLEVAPRHWPSLARGKEVFAQNCVSCHGTEGKGDGPASQALTPKPANFLDEKRMAELPPLQAFNTIRLGVPGTGMPSFTSFSDEDAWSVGFYIIALRYGVQNTATVATIDSGTLKLVATSSDEALRKILPGDDATKNLRIKELRLHTENEDIVATVLGTARSLLGESLSAYRDGNFEVAKTKALRAYLEGIEPIEPRARATDPSAVTQLEEWMSAVRGSIEARHPVEAVAGTIQAANEQMNVVQKLISHQEISPGVAFAAASAVILREGFEAVLLILALLSVIRAAGSRRAALWVHGGWITALLCGGIAWMFSGYLVDISGAQRELIEASTSLFAVVVLIFVGFWLHSRTEIGRWTHFIDVKVRKALEGKNLFGLASIAFIAVFREAFETVLFLRAIWLEGGAPVKASMAGGVIITLVAIIAGAWAMLRHSVRIPVRQLFAVSSMIMAVLAFILTGKGLHSLQEAGTLDVTAIGISLHSDIVGLFPTYQTLLPQIFVLVLVAGLWVYGRRPSTVPVRVATSANDGSP